MGEHPVVLGGPILRVSRGVNGGRRVGRIVGSGVQAFLRMSVAGSGVDSGDWMAWGL